MNIEELREYCLSLPQVVENQPWTEPQYEMLITYKIGGKWFVLADPDKKFIDVKCDPETIADMQSHYQGAFPAWHMNKEHWLGVTLASDIPDGTIKKLIRDGYDMVVAKLPKKTRDELAL
ncbi:MAG: MmcQ/YjbR family DNA-binding protein [Pseudoflavonifractor sp.]|nr:MmcQ/YjbR family DNA-binding protein [Pseudoflavonifractor sp.]